MKILEIIKNANYQSVWNGEYKKLTRLILKQRMEIHREVDIAINRMEKEIGEMKVKHRSILQKHLDEIKQFQSPMLQTL